MAEILILLYYLNYVDIAIIFMFKQYLEYMSLWFIGW